MGSFYRRSVDCRRGKTRRVESERLGCYDNLSKRGLFFCCLQPLNPGRYSGEDARLVFKFTRRREKRDGSQSVGCCGGNHVGADVYLSLTTHLSVVRFRKDDGRKSGKLKTGDENK